MAQLTDSLDRTTLPVTADQIRELIAGLDTVVKFRELKDDTPFGKAGADSLDVFNIVIAVEDRYGIAIPSDRLGSVNTLGKMAGYLNERLS